MLTPIKVSNRPTSPDHLVLLDAKDLGPTEDEAADFDKELSKMLSDAAADAKKVDRKAALSAWDTGVTTTGGVARRKKDIDRVEAETPKDVMRFAVLTKKANKNAVSLPWSLEFNPLLTNTLDPRAGDSDYFCIGSPNPVCSNTEQTRTRTIEAYRFGL